MSSQRTPTAGVIAVIAIVAIVAAVLYFTVSAGGLALYRPRSRG